MLKSFKLCSLRRVSILGEMRSSANAVSLGFDFLFLSARSSSQLSVNCACSAMRTGSMCPRFECHWKPSIVSNGPVSSDQLTSVSMIAAKTKPSGRYPDTSLIPCPV